jgi:hypothetical protein
MGCDVQMVLEQHDKELGWVGIDAFRHRAGVNVGINKGFWPAATDRNYRRFAALAGVRGEGPKPRGVPEDSSALTKLLVAECSGFGHSHSWLPLTDAIKIFLMRFYEREKPLDPKSYEAKYPASFWFGVETTADMDNYRIVFWFDNSIPHD